MYHLEITKPGSKYYHKSDYLMERDARILEHTYSTAEPFLARIFSRTDAVKSASVSAIFSPQCVSQPV